MQIVIDIDDDLYTRLFDNGDEYVADMRRACVAIRKGHGNFYDTAYDLSDGIVVEQTEVEPQESEVRND